GFELRRRTRAPSDMRAASEPKPKIDLCIAMLPCDLRSVLIAVLAKAPIPGLAKTRLIPALGAPGAARLQRQLTRAAVRTALDAELGSVTVWCAPQARHRFFRALQRTTP